MTAIHDTICAVVADWNPRGYMALRTDVFTHPTRLRRSWVTDSASSAGVAESRFLEDAGQFSSPGELAVLLKHLSYGDPRVEYTIYPVYGRGRSPSWKRMCPNPGGCYLGELSQRALMEAHARSSVDVHSLEESLDSMNLSMGDVIAIGPAHFVCVEASKRVLLEWNYGWRLDLDGDIGCIRWGRASEARFNKLLRFLE